MFGFSLHANAQIVGTSGNVQGLTDITIRKGRETFRLPCDTLGVSGGWNPNLALTCHMNGRPSWDENLHAFVPTPGAVPGLEPAGAALGIWTTQGALTSGAECGGRVVQSLGRTAGRIKIPVADDTSQTIAPLGQGRSGCGDRPRRAQPGRSADRGDVPVGDRLVQDPALLRGAFLRRDLRRMDCVTRSPMSSGLDENSVSVPGKISLKKCKR